MSVNRRETKAVSMEYIQSGTGGGWKRRVVTSVQSWNRVSAVICCPEQLLAAAAGEMAQTS